MTLNPDYVWRMAKLTQEERLQTAADNRRVRGLPRDDGWWRPVIRWVIEPTNYPPRGRTDRRAS